MTRAIVSALALLLLLPAASAAHRLDEYLQATRVALARDRIALELHLTPGVSIAPQIVALIDRDANGQIAPDEARAYGAAVVGEIVLQLDGRDLPLTLTDVRVPAIDEMRDGMGAIRIEASAAVSTAPGAHALVYRNDHRPDVSVYLVNTLMPDTRAISIASQQRDPRQREFHLDYQVNDPSAAIAWTVAAAVALGALTVSRRTSSTQFLRLAPSRRRC